MIKRTIEISREPAHLTVRLDQLLLQRGEETVASIPCEDIGVVLVDEPRTTYSQAALTGLARSDAVLVVCGNDHLPAGVLLPLADHCQMVWRIAQQVAIRKPLRKQLWQQLVRAKIRAQALNLPQACPARQKLVELSRRVRSGDPANVEAHAARVYWRHWLPGVAFRREKDGDGTNALLNYGYAILRAAVARALVAAGLMPASACSTATAPTRSAWPTTSWNRFARWWTAACGDCTGRAIRNSIRKRRRGCSGCWPIRCGWAASAAR